MTAATLRYQRRTLAMLEDWARGIRRHNNIDDECLPDFSCCNPEMFERNDAKRAARLADYRAKHPEAAQQ